jgi:hypothetical protein
MVAHTYRAMYAPPAQDGGITPATFLGVDIVGGVYHSSAPGARRKVGFAPWPRLRRGTGTPTGALHHVKWSGIVAATRGWRSHAFQCLRSS